MNTAPNDRKHRTSPALLDDVAFDSLRPRIRGAVLATHYDNEIVAWSPIAPAPAYLDPVAAVAFQMLDGEVSLGELVADVSDVLGLPSGVARSQLRRALSLFDDATLLTTSAPAPSPEPDFDIFPAPPNP